VSFFKNIYKNILVFFKKIFFIFSKQKNINSKKNIDKQLVFSLSKSRIPNLKQLKHIKKFLTNKELWIVRISFLILIICILFSSGKFYLNHLQIVPIAGGEYTEALIGSPKYINPLYANINDVDSDLCALIFSSLFKRDKNGKLIKDLVEDYNISEDNKIYSIKLKQNIKWHNGENLTVNDIIFTFNSIKNNAYKSTLKQSFVGVEIEQIDDNNFKFILQEPYAAFLDLLTFGIMPSKIWSEITPELADLTKFNLNPIGSGIYRFDKIVKDETGNIREFSLKPNEYYYENKPYIDLKFKFFSGFIEAIDAINTKKVDGISYLPYEYKNSLMAIKTKTFYKLHLPQLTLIFLNKKHNIFLADKSVRQALSYAINKEDIINNILGGDAYAISGTILPDNFAYNPSIEKYEYNKEKAEELLNNIDWKIEEITEEKINQAKQDIFSEDEKIQKNAEAILKVGIGKWRKKNNNFLIIKFSTAERNKNKKIILAISNYWKQIGIKTEIEILSISQIQNKIIKPRNFDALFYGQITGADPDPYPFWHSSQTNEDGYNIANFINKDVDQLLEDARLISDIAERQKKYKKFQEIISEEIPAIFIYSPVYTYMQDKKIKGFNIKNIFYPSDRFANINEWYLKTGKKLKIKN